MRSFRYFKRKLMPVGVEPIIKKVAHCLGQKRKSAKYAPVFANEPIDPQHSMPPYPELTGSGIAAFGKDNAIALLQHRLRASQNTLGGFAAKRCKVELLCSIELHDLPYCTMAERTLFIEKNDI